MHVWQTVHNVPFCSLSHDFHGTQSATRSKFSMCYVLKALILSQTIVLQIRCVFVQNRFHIESLVFACIGETENMFRQVAYIPACSDGLWVGGISINALKDMGTKIVPLVFLSLCVWSWLLTFQKTNVKWPGSNWSQEDDGNDNPG